MVSVRGYLSVLNKIVFIKVTANLTSDKLQQQQQQQQKQKQQQQQHG